MVPLDTGPGLVAFGIEDAAVGLAFLGRVGQEAEVKWGRAFEGRRRGADSVGSGSETQV